MGPLGTEIQRESKEFYVSDQFYEKTVIAKIAFSPHTRLIMVQWFLSMAFGKLLYRQVKLKNINRLRFKEIVAENIAQLV